MLNLNCLRVLRGNTLIPILICGKKTIIWKERVREVQDKSVAKSESNDLIKEK